MFSSPAEQSEFMARLHFIWDPPEMSKVLSEEHSNKTIVHAELFLLGYFEKHRCTFLDGNDRYIGCSKPASYLCHAYIKNHPGRYAVPPFHQKFYIRWRHPDIDINVKAYATLQEKIMLKLIDCVRDDIATDIRSRT